MRRRWTAVLGAVAAVLAAGVAAAPAGATDLTVQANVCGSSYARIDTYPIKRDGVLYGQVELYWSATAKRNCAVTVGGSRAYGWKGFKEAWVCPSDASATLCGEDRGDFYYYAGPAYTPSGYNMSGRCVDVGGIVEYPGGTTADGGAFRVHCG